MQRRTNLHRLLATVVSAPLIAMAAGCGDDGGSTAAPPSASGTTTTAVSGVKAFCEAWTAIDMTDQPGGPDDSSPEANKAFAALIDPLFQTAKANAPASLADSLTVMTGVVAKLTEGDGSGIEEPEFAIANEAIEDVVRTQCGYGVVDVSAKEYAFAMPASVSTGAVSVRLTNSGNEPHVLLFVKKPADGSGNDPAEFVGRYLEAVFSGDPAQMEKFASVNVAGGGPFAAPGTVGTKVTDFTAGDYYYFCPIPVGGVESAPPHFTQGMLGQFTVK